MSQGWPGKSQSVSENKGQVRATWDLESGGGHRRWFCRRGLETGEPQRELSADVQARELKPRAREG